MMAAILDLGPKRGFAIRGVGLCCGTPVTNSFQVRKLCLHFVQPESFFAGTTGGHSYEDIGMQV